MPPARSITEIQISRRGVWEGRRLPLSVGGPPTCADINLQMPCSIALPLRDGGRGESIESRRGEGGDARSARQGRTPPPTLPRNLAPKSNPDPERFPFFFSRRRRRSSSEGIYSVVELMGVSLLLSSLFLVSRPISPQLRD